MSKGGQPVTNRPFLSRKQVMAHQALLAESKRIKGLIDRCIDLAQLSIDDAQATRKIARQTLRLAKAMVGDYGTATAGDDGTAMVGDRGTATAGYGGSIVVRRWDGTRSRIVVGYVGESGIKPGVAYRVDENGGWVAA